MILVTGATETVGREVVRALSGTGQTFMVMVRSEAARERLERAGIPIAADCNEPAHLTKIVPTFTLELSSEWSFGNVSQIILLASGAGEGFSRDDEII